LSQVARSGCGLERMAAWARSSIHKIVVLVDHPVCMASF
jgi:hypothetical protein